MGRKCLGRNVTEATHDVKVWYLLIVHSAIFSPIQFSLGKWPSNVLHAVFSQTGSLLALAAVLSHIASIKCFHRQLALLP
jgi:hypothetical protein